MASESDSFKILYDPVTNELYQLIPASGDIFLLKFEEPRVDVDEGRLVEVADINLFESGKEKGVR